MGIRSFLQCVNESLRQLAPVISERRTRMVLRTATGRNDTVLPMRTSQAEISKILIDDSPTCEVKSIRCGQWKPGEMDEGGRHFFPSFDVIMFVKAEINAPLGVIDLSLVRSLDPVKQLALQVMFDEGWLADIIPDLSKAWFEMYSNRDFVVAKSRLDLCDKIERRTEGTILVTLPLFAFEDSFGIPSALNMTSHFISFHGFCKVRTVWFFCRRLQDKEQRLLAAGANNFSSLSLLEKPEGEVSAISVGQWWCAGIYSNSNDPGIQLHFHGEWRPFACSAPVRRPFGFRYFFPVRRFVRGVRVTARDSYSVTKSFIHVRDGIATPYR